MVLGPFCCVSHLWRFFVRFAVESAYPSALQEFVIGWSRLTGFPLELSAVTGFVGHFLLRRLVLGLGFYSFHRLDVYPWSELISEDEKKEKGSGIKTRKIAVMWEQPPHCSNWEGFCPHPVRFTKKKKRISQLIFNLILYTLVHQENFKLNLIYLICYSQPVAGTGQPIATSVDETIGDFLASPLP